MQSLLTSFLLVFSLQVGVPPASSQGFPETQRRALVTLLEQQTEQVPGWPWEKGSVRPSENLGGVIGLTLLQLYERAPDAATWVTLVQYSHHLRDAYAPRDRLPYKADLEFLARMANAGLDPEAETFAAALFDRVRRQSPTGALEYERIAAGRAQVPEIIGYDIALSIRAAVAVGEREYADQLADAALAAERLRLSDPNDSFQVTSVGALVYAIALLERPQDVSALERAAKSLMEAQAANGAWAVNNTQATAYAVLGLTSMRSVKWAVAAANRGRAWLASRQLKSGEWAAYHDGLPEPFVGPVVPLAQAEALAAMLAMP